MSGFHQRFNIGTTSFPKTLTDIDIGLCFRLSKEDVDALRSRYRDNALGPAILLVFLRASGRHLENLTLIPALLLKYLCAELQLRQTSIASLKSLYKRPTTLTAHRQWVLENLANLAPATPEKLDDLGLALKALASTAVSTEDLVKRGELWLLDNQLLIPHERVLRSIASRAFEAETVAAIEVVRLNVTEALAQKALKAVYSGRKGRTGGTNLEWLKEPPGKHGLHSLREASKKIAFLKELGVHLWDISAIGGARIRAYARAVVHRAPSATKALSEKTQVLEVCGFLRATLLEFTDNAFYTAGRHLNRLIGQGRNRV
ncbi:DUF4158 domain-containing protein [Acidovorax sp. 107]|jgi:hypothetical protein|uniref:DUF4158 domain-containing protein n=1 Tax=Acidovorax sp. 107 TaxID=2135638 RepID=UPI000D3AF5C0|nr:DUF4158 domain-containing protein [Acidovorax sp. 107]